MNTAMANQIAVRMLIGFVIALAALLAGVILIRRMRLLVNDDAVPEPRSQDQARVAGATEHKTLLPRGMTSH